MPLSKTAAIWRAPRQGVPSTSSFPSTDKTFHRGSTDYFVNARKGDIGAFDSPKFIGLPVGEVLKVGKDHLDVEVSEPLTNGDGLNVMIKREVVGFRANTVDKTGENRYQVWPNEMPADLPQSASAPGAQP
ncbi:hypothetical protein LNO81_15795 [Klebsiella variicola subsp. variicola]|nr:hypothetical protein [Klebsiella variicola subsp. variicola]